MLRDLKLNNLDLVKTHCIIYVKDMNRRNGFTLFVLIILMVVVATIIYSSVFFAFQTLNLNTIRLYKHQAIMAQQAGIMNAAYEILQNNSYANTTEAILNNQWYSYKFQKTPTAGESNSTINASASYQMSLGTISGWTITNSSTEVAIITRLQISWIPTTNNLIEIRLGGTSVWTGSAVSGSEIDIPDVIIPPSSTLTNNIIDFSGNMTNSNIYITFFFRNGTAITRRVWQTQNPINPDGGPWYPTNLYSWWKMNEGAGTTVYDIINPNGALAANNLTKGAQATWTTSGRFGGAISFNGGNNAELTGTTSSSLANGQFSVSAWIYLNSLPSNTYGYGIVSRGTGGPPLTMGYELYVNNNTDGTIARRRKIIFNVGNGTSARLAVSSAIPPTTTWIHVVGTYDGTNIRLYINGTLDTSNTGGISNPSTTFYIGNRRNLNSSNMNGIIDEVAYFNRALTSFEVLSLYTPNIPSYGSPTFLISTGKFIDNNNNNLMNQTAIATFEKSGSTLRITKYNEILEHN